MACLLLLLLALLLLLLLVRLPSFYSRCGTSGTATAAAVSVQRISTSVECCC
jgi:hypothetical protein